MNDRIIGILRYLFVEKPLQGALVVAVALAVVAVLSYIFGVETVKGWIEAVWTVVIGS